MIRFAAALLALVALPAAAQTVVGAGVSFVPVVGGYAGEERFIESTATLLRLDASHAAGRVGGSDLTVEAALSAASVDFFGEGDASPLSLRAADLGASLSTPISSRGHLHTRLGIVLDIGPDLFDGADLDEESVSTDGSHALRLGAAVRQRAGGFALWAGADAFLTPVRRVDLPYVDESGAITDSTLAIRLRPGHTLVARGGVAHVVGPVTLGAEVVASVRGDSRSEAIGSSLPPSREAGATVVSLVPSVTWRRARLSVEAAVRSPGLLFNEHVETGVPLAVSRARVARWPVSLRVAYGF